MRLRFLAALGCAIPVLAASSFTAHAIDETQLTFSGVGTAPSLGYGDVEQNVRDSSNAADWSVYSLVNNNTGNSDVTVSNNLGYTSYNSSTTTVNNARSLNYVHSVTDSGGVYGTMDWIHETATATWVPGSVVGGNGAWFTFWHTYPKSAVDQDPTYHCVPLGSGVNNLGWIGYESQASPAGTGVQPPAQSTLDATKETRGWVGTYWNYSGDPTFAARVDQTNTWATGSPSQPPGVTANTYRIWTEPSVTYDNNGHLLLVMTGIKDGNIASGGTGGYQNGPCSDFNGDVWLFTYTFSTGLWSNGCKVIDSSSASSFDSLVPSANYVYLTGSHIFMDPSTPGQVDLVESPVNRYGVTNDLGYQVPIDNYNGLLLFGLGGTGDCTASYVSNVSPTGSETHDTFMGAGGYWFANYDHAGTNMFQMHKYCTDSSGNVTSIRVGVWNPSGSHDLCT
ncbi:MAG TPA: hypothetical protein VFC09_13870 [Candidatus Dormibacteraeota bacterium]|nr:hypothetical protein [Candidatus Dormibacteraeota bacterium]